MSSDDGIYIGYFMRDMTPIYAVACVAAIDNLKYNEEMRRYDDYVHYVRQNWGNGPFFSTFEKASEYATHLQKVERTEYGIKSVGKLNCPLNDDDTLPRMDIWEPDFNSTKTSKVPQKPKKFFVLDPVSGEASSFDSLEKAKVEAKVMATKYVFNSDRKILVVQQIYSIEAKTNVEYIEEE